MSEPQVVLWNDDGWGQPDLVNFVQAVLGLPRAVRMFPRRDQTGQGGFLRIQEPIKVQYHENDVIVVDGYPAEFPYIARHLFGDDLVFVAVNRGWNIDLDIYNSATVMSIVQSMWIGFRGIAFNFSREAHTLEDVELHTRLIRHYFKRMVYEGRSYSINFPEVPNNDNMKTYHLNRVHRNSQVDQDDIMVAEKETPVGSIFRIRDVGAPESEGHQIVRRGMTHVVDLLDAGL